MAKYENLASINLELLDGNLAATPSITGPITLVIGTAYTGQSNKPLIVDDFNKAAAIFGASSELMKAANEVKLGGSRNVAVYRIGGVPASITGIFGEYTEITTNEEKYGIGQEYRIYVGPQQNNASERCIIIFEGATKIVYSNVPGSEVDLGKFTIVGFDENFAYRIGTQAVPVILDNALTSLKADTTQAFTATALQTDFILSDAVSALIPSDASTGLIKVSVNGTPVTTGVSIAIGNNTTPTPDKLVFTSGLAASDAVSVTYERNATIAGALYQPGEDNVLPTQQKLYEMIDNALLDLETTSATHIVIPQAKLDAPNIADGSTATDKLTYVSRTLTEDGYTWEWSSSKVLYQLTSTPTYTTNIALAQTDGNGQPIVSKVYSEVNFAHRLGMYLTDMAENDKFMLGAIGTSLPVSGNTMAVNGWLGTLPIKNIFGEVIASGTGLLGNRYMSGNTGQASGFYKTDSGYPDGNVIYDSVGSPVDLGKFMSVVIAAVSTPKSPILGITARTINAAALYIGALTLVTPGESTTNRVIPNVGLPFALKKTRVNEIAGAGYVAFMDQDGSVLCASGELPTGDGSDYDYVSTSIIVADITNRIRVRLNPFLGKGLGAVQLAAMQTIVDDEFVKAVQAGYIVKYSAQVILQSVVNGKARVRIPYVLVPTFELREVNQSLVLAYDI